MLALKKHPKDQMTPKERSEAIKNNQPFDRLPVSLFATEIKARMIDCKMRDLYKNVDRIVEAEVYVFNTYGSDGLSSGPNSYGIAEALGANVTYPKDNIPRIEEAVIEDYSQLTEMNLIDVINEAPIQIYLEATERLSALAEGITGVGVSIGGPLTIAAYLRDTTQLMKDFIKKPDQAEELLDRVVQAQKKCVDAFLEYDVSFSLGDPIASPAIISPRQFEKFAKPYLAELADYIYEKTGRGPSLHICGKTEAIWESIKELNISAFSLDNEVDIGEANRFFGDKIAVTGNIPPVDVIYNGSQEEIEESVRQCIEKAYDTPAGFVIAPGCNLPISTPIENVGFFMDAARKYGQYDFLEKLDSNRGK
ncbi:MAG: uroporphyrinogen decarboxylase family protein [Atopococcus tabaci]|uniref:Uroporphyrinogen decarboxylase family protein n=1 Tax=Atopococcus tabaci TaxID=269774 RepID=A0AA43UCA6_9LACT|nr:uroporphyrinogen decarboxylase family protein [Atopococcus tabaci]